jgi:hypothetical protein
MFDSPPHEPNAKLGAIWQDLVFSAPKLLRLGPRAANVRVLHESEDPSLAGQRLMCGLPVRFLQIRDTAVTRGAKSPSRGSSAPTFTRNWSGARDLNPGPHGPEPYIPRVLPYPAGSSSVLLFSISRPVVSSRVLPCPSGSANARHICDTPSAQTVTLFKGEQAGQVARLPHIRRVPSRHP